MFLLETPYRYLVILIVTGFVMSALKYFGEQAHAGKSGGKRIGPTPTHWFSLLLGGAFLAICIHVRLFVGSARSDADHQMSVLTGLIIALSLGLAFVVYEIVRIRRTAFEWLGNQFAFSTSTGERISLSTDDLVYAHRAMSGWIVLSFANGEMVKLTPNARRMNELGQAIAEVRPDLFANGS